MSCAAEGAEQSANIEVVRSSKARLLEPEVSTPEQATFSAGMDAFACDLYTQQAAREGNLFFSPHSIETAFAMAYAGARAVTAEQMATTLHFELPAEQLHRAFDKQALALETRFEKTKSKLQIVNALWSQRNLELEGPFLDTLAVYYDTGLNPLDFAATPELARHAINEWVSDATDQHIPELLPENAITTKTRLALTNAVEFEARWAHRFDPMATTDQTFHVSADKDVSVEMMRDTQTESYYAEPGLRVLRLDYEDKRLGLWVVLPDDLQELEAELSPELFERVEAGFVPTGVQYAIPKLELRTSFKLKDTLTAMGMRDAFTSEADFGAIATLPLHIDEAYHQAYLKVDEEGTKAAAATAVVLEVDGGATFFEDLVEFVADSPFLIVIRDTPSKTTLFLGRIVNPAD
jgi:serpin B